MTGHYPWGTCWDPIKQLSGYHDIWWKLPCVWGIWYRNHKEKLTTKPLFIDHLLYMRRCDQILVYIVLTPYNSVNIIIPSYRWEHRDSKKSGNFPKASECPKGLVKDWRQAQLLATWPRRNHGADWFFSHWVVNNLWVMKSIQRLRTVLKSRID